MEITHSSCNNNLSHTSLDYFPQLQRCSFLQRFGLEISNDDSISPQIGAQHIHDINR